MPPAAPADDATLLEAWRAGDDRSGERLFDRHADLIARFFENKVREGAEDLTQATFLRAIESQPRLRESAAFGGFLLGIARNVLRQHLRVLVRGREVDPEVDSMAELAPGPSSVIGERQEHRLLLEGLRHLAIDDQIILELFYWEKLKGDEIAEIMGVSPASARGRLSRARDKLRDKMAEISASPELLASTLRGLDTWAGDLRGRLGGVEESAGRFGSRLSAGGSPGSASSDPS